MMSFKDKVVIVTGASSGIGAAVAVAFSAEGARVVMVGRNETKLAAVAARCERPLVLRADVAHDDDVRRVLRQTIHTFGQLDILVNNAGIMSTASLLEGDIMKTYDSIASVNLRAVIHLSSLASPYLIKTKGNIVNISSVAGKMTYCPSVMPYAVTKAGVNHFSEYAAVELAPYGVRVNTVSPGPVRTDILENSKAEHSWEDCTKSNVLNRVSEPEEIADLVLFLASNKSKGVTGSNYVSDNGSLIKVKI